MLLSITLDTFNSIQFESVWMKFKKKLKWAWILNAPLLSIILKLYTVLYFNSVKVAMNIEYSSPEFQSVQMQLKCKPV